MLEPLLQSFMDLMARIAGYEPGASGFYIISAAFLAAVIFVVRLLAGAFGSSRGIIISAVAVLIPLGMALIGYVLTEAYVVPMLSDATADWVVRIAPWTGFGLVLFLCTMLFSTRLMDMNMVGLSIIFMFAALAGIGTCYGAGLLIGMTGEGQQQQEQRGNRLQHDLKGLVE